MENKIRKLLDEAKLKLSSIILNEDKDFMTSLVTGNLQTKEHEAKKNEILDLIKRIENLNKQE